jgi:hypothetical protein
MSNRRGIELFARGYPHDYRGRGDPAEARPSPEKLRDPGADAAPRLTGSSTSSWTQSVYYMLKMLLAVLHAPDAARGARGAGSSAAPAPSPSTTSRWRASRWSASRWSASRWTHCHRGAGHMILTTARPSPVRSQRLEVIVAAGNLRADLQARRVGTILKRFHGRLLSRLGAVRAL